MSNRVRFVTLCAILLVSVNAIGSLTISVFPSTDCSGLAKGTSTLASGTCASTYTLTCSTSEIFYAQHEDELCSGPPTHNYSMALGCVTNGVESFLSSCDPTAVVASGASTVQLALGTITAVLFAVVALYM